MGRLLNIQDFKSFHLMETEKSPLSGTFSVNEDVVPSPVKKGKEESYRSIAYKLSEIFGLYGFFFAQKPGFMKPDQWKKYTSDIVKITDPTEKWKKIIDTVSEFQNKVSSPEILPSKGEFGHLGQYSYEQETSQLPTAAKLLKNAHDAIFKTFNPEEQKKSITILNSIISGTKALSLE
jgi:hypothetical protein